MLYRYPGYYCETGRAEVTEVPGTGMYEGRTELRQVAGTGINILQNSQTFCVWYFPGENPGYVL